MRKKLILAALGLGVVLALIASTRFTLFVVQPIGAVPEGRTVLISRAPGGKLIDSADAICERRMGGVSLLCRMTALQTVTESRTWLRLPYSRTLYLLSTGGEEYGR